MQVKRAFTLLELLVAIGILGVLAGVVIIAINPQKQLGEADETRMRADAGTLEKALQQYKIDNKKLPFSLPNAASLGRAICSQGATSGDCVNLEAQLVPTYLAAIPQDPLVTGYSGYRIYQNSQGSAAVYNERIDGYGLALWLDASDYQNTLFNNADCSPPAAQPISGFSTVRCWKDKSEWANHMISAGSSIPTMLIPPPAVVPPGVAMRLRRKLRDTSLSHAPWQGFTLSFYGRSIDFTETFILESTQLNVELGNSPGDRFKITFGGLHPELPVLSPQFPSLKYHYVITFDPTADTMQLFVNGQLDNSVNPVAPSPVGSGPMLATIGSNHEDLGDLFEMHLFTKPLKAADIQSLYSYVSQKY